MDHNQLWEILKEMRIPRPSYLPPEKLYVGQEVTELDMGQQTGFKLGKEYVKSVFCHTAYLTYMWHISCEILGWMKHNWNQVCWRNINNLRYADDSALNGRK